ncbi:MAG: signal peptidase II [Crocinitomicaceae bacterium]
MKKKTLWLTGLVLFLLVLDQCVKLYVKTHVSRTEPWPVFGSWFEILYTENQGMAFGTTFGSSAYGKLFLSSFRLAAIGAIVYFLMKEIKRGGSTLLLTAIAFILAGASGNLIDSMFYDFIFPFNPCDGFNQLQGSGIRMKCTHPGFSYPVEVRNHGFMYGNVVDMFHLKGNWPKGIPFVGGSELFPFIWNVADTCITIGVGLFFIASRKSNPKNKEKEPSVSEA